MMSSCEPNRTKRYSEDIRWRIIWLRIVQDLTFRQIAKKLCIGFGTVARIWNLFQLTGNVSVQSPFDNKRMHLRVLDEYHELFIIGIILECPTVYLHELCVVIQKATNVDVSIPTLCRLLKRYEMTRKKIQRIALQRSSILRAEFMAHMFLYNLQVLVWLDETGSDKRNFLRKYGYSLRGERAVKHTFLSRGKRINVILAISSSGVVSRYLTERSIDSCVFYDFICGELIQNLQPFDGVSKTL